MTEEECDAVERQACYARMSTSRGAAAARRGWQGVSSEPPAAAGMQAPLKLSSEGAHEEAVVSTRTREDADGRLRNLAAAFE